MQIDSTLMYLLHFLYSVIIPIVADILFQIKNVLQ